MCDSNDFLSLKRTRSTPVQESFDSVEASGLLASLRQQNLALDHLRRALEKELARSPLSSARPKHFLKRA